MIKVQAIREPAQKQRPGREDHESPERRGSLVPLGFLLFLAGCAAYFKSFLSATLQVSETKADQKTASDNDDGRQEALAADSDEKITEAEPEPEVDADEDVTGAIGRKAKSSDNVIALRPAPQAVDEFLADDSPAMDFSAQQRQPSYRTEFGSGGVIGRSANENHNSGGSGPETSRAGGGGGAGGSGGGPGGGPGGGGAGGAGGAGGGAGSGGSGSDPGPKQPPVVELPRNRAPRTSGPVQLQDIVGCHAYLISVLSLLQGTTDPDGDRLALGAVSASSGTLTLIDGGWMFTPEQGMLGAVTLTFYITDGVEIIQQTAQFRVLEAPPIIGTNGDDNLLGTQCADVIDGRSGDDNIDARGGDDQIIGGDGDDHIVAGAGNDVVLAGAGNDIVFGGRGNDVIYGGEGNDRLFGGEDQDTIYGQAGDDVIEGGEGADILFAGAGNDTVFGDQGNDIISDGDGEDMVRGGDGDDYVIAAMDAASDSYAGDAGEDTLDYSSATVNILIDVRRGRAEGLEIGKDLISGFERIISGHGDDHLIAGSTSISMTGGDGDDTFEFDRPDDNHQPDLIRKITDFTVGDRIIAASYEIRYRQDADVSQAVGDLFDNIYLSDERDRPIRFRLEKMDNDDRTFVDVRDRSDSETFYSIELSGHHHLEVFVGIS